MVVAMLEQFHRLVIKDSNRMSLKIEEVSWSSAKSEIVVYSSLFLLNFRYCY